MARNRMLNPEFWLDEEVAKLTPFARLLYMGLWGICDDNYATLPDRPDWIKAQIFPYEILDVSQLLKELEGVGKIIKFEEDGKPYWYVKNFFKYQKVDRPSAPKYPKYPHSLGEDSTSTRSEVKRREVKLSKVYIDHFEMFWSAYPRKVSKRKAEQVFLRIAPNKKLFDTIMQALEEHKKSPQWVKDGGQFIPHPTTWLNQERWNDQLKVVSPTASKFASVKSTKIKV